MVFCCHLLCGDAFIKAAVEVFLSQWAPLSHSDSQIFTGHSFWSSSNQAFGGNVIMLLGWNEALKGAQNKRNRLQKFHHIVAMVVDGPLHQPSWFKSLNTKLRKKTISNHLLMASKRLLASKLVRVYLPLQSGYSRSFAIVRNDETWQISKMSSERSERWIWEKPSYGKLSSIDIGLPIF